MKRSQKESMMCTNGANQLLFCSSCTCQIDFPVENDNQKWLRKWSKRDIEEIISYDMTWQNFLRAKHTHTQKKRGLIKASKPSSVLVTMPLIAHFTLLYKRQLQLVLVQFESFTPKASAKLKFKFPLMVLLLPTPPSPCLIIAANSS